MCSTWPLTSSATSALLTLMTRYSRSALNSREPLNPHTVNFLGGKEVLENQELKSKTAACTQRSQPGFSTKINIQCYGNRHNTSSRSITKFTHYFITIKFHLFITAASVSSFSRWRRRGQDTKFSHDDRCIRKSRHFPPCRSTPRGQGQHTESPRMHTSPNN
jgi:hypothetical protein